MTICRVGIDSPVDVFRARHPPWPEDIKVGGHDGRGGTSFRDFSPEASRKTKEKMRASVALALICAICMIASSNGTTVKRVARTLPFDLSPSKWAGMFRALWSGGRFLEWPRNSVESLLRLVAMPNTRKKLVFEFRPDDGPRASNIYQSRYGYRGEWLIQLLGSGFHPDGVPYRQHLPASILVPPPPHF